MGLFFRRRAQSENRQATVSHFEAFVATRRGVEAYYERQAGREPSSLMLVASDGEWTRRRVPDAAEGARLAANLGIPFYEVAKVGYPDSVRRWNEAQRRR